MASTPTTTIINSQVSGTVGLKIGRNSALTDVVELGSTSNDFTGGVTIGLDNTLRLGNSEVIPDTNLVTVSSGSTLNVNGKTETVKSITSSGSINGGGTLIIANPAGETFAGVISGTTTITKNGSGTLILTGANTYTGGTTIGAGTLQVGAGSNIGALSNTGTVTNNGTITFNRSDSYTYSGTITGTGALTQAGAGTLILSGTANNYSSATNFNAGTLQMSGSSTLGTGQLNFNGGGLSTSADRGTTTNNIPNTIVMTANTLWSSAPSSGTRNLVFTTNSLSGTGGTLTIQNNGTGGTFDTRLNGADFSFSRPIAIGVAGDVGATQLSLFNTSTTGTTGTQTFTGVISGPGTIRRSATTAGTGGTTVFTNQNTYSGGTSLNDGTIAFGSSSVGPASAPTSGPIGTGTLTIGSSNNPAVKASGGARVVGNQIAMNNGMQFIGSDQLEMSGSVALGTGTRTLTVTNTANTILSGSISGTGGINKAGAGVLTLTGANVYGAVAATSTTVSAGTLVVANTSGSGLGVGDAAITGGTLTVNGSISGSVNNTGGILNGSGTIGGNVTINGATATLSPGNSPGTLNIGGTLNLTSGTYKYEIDSSTPTADLVNVAGALNITAAAVSLAASDVPAQFLAYGTKFTLISYAGAWNNGTFIGLPNYDTSLVVGANRYQIIYNDATAGSANGAGVLYPTGVTITAVPEASAFLTVGLGCIFAVAAVWMSKRLGVNPLNVG